MEEFTGEEEQIGLLVKDGDADAPNEKSYIKNAENETTLHCDEWELPQSGWLTKILRVGPHRGIFDCLRVPTSENSPSKKKNH